MEDKYLNVKEVMAYTGVSRRTIYNWLNGGKIQRYNTPGGSPRFKQSDLIGIKKHEKIARN